MKINFLRLKVYSFFAIIIALFFFDQPITAQSLSSPVYLSPRPGAILIPPETTIAVRFNQNIDAATLTHIRFEVIGTKSGIHRGAVVLAQDHRTIIFKPAQKFALGEQVNVIVSREPALFSGGTIDRIAQFSFIISASERSAPPTDSLLLLPENQPAQRRPTPLVPKAPSQPSNLPYSFPGITVTVPATGTAPGYIFTAPFPLFGSDYTYLLILDNSGQPVYYNGMPGGAYDFKKQPNGLLTYYNGGLFYALDSSYQIVDTFQMGNGYSTDVHELLLTNSGHALMMSYDFQNVDMSQIAPGGYPTATVIGLIVQELDAAKNVLFEWRSWDHFLITDTQISLTTAMVDYVHGNAIEVDNDGNLLISSRHLSEITKINRTTADIIWRLGGKNNQFTFVNDSPPRFQHDIRRLANGNISIFDNRVDLVPVYSRAAEFQIDEVGKVITLTWEYRNTPDNYSFAMGDARRLSNGNTIISWGTVSQITEVMPDGTKAFELNYASPNVSYRAFRFEWHGYPTTMPWLTRAGSAGAVKLFVSWNGATEIASFKIFSGNTLNPTNLVTTVSKTGFETQYNVPGQATDCIYRVMPVDVHGADTQYSNAVNVCNWFYQFFPLIFR